MVDEAERSRHAREAAEQALVRIVHHYGGKPEFVVLGGLVPELLLGYGGGSAETWVRMQADYDLWQARQNRAA